MGYPDCDSTALFYHSELDKRECCYTQFQQVSPSANKPPRYFFPPTFSKFIQPLIFSKMETFRDKLLRTKAASMA
jgi:hypothetical protein